MKITKITSNYCGGFKPPKGHLDTQMFPECENFETDRNIVRKTVERRKKGKKKTKKASIQVEAKHGEPISGEEGIWTQWKSGIISDETFVDTLLKYKKAYEAFIADNSMIKWELNKVLSNYRQNHDASSDAKHISVLLSYEDVANEGKKESLVEANKKFNLCKYLRAISQIKEKK